MAELLSLKMYQSILYPVWFKRAGGIAQSVVRLTQEPEVPGPTLGPATYFVSPSADSGRAVVTPKEIISQTD